MPVLSPHHTSSSYRSALDRPSYYNSPSFSPRITTTFSERYTTRSYIDSDGRRTFSRSGSITEDGITSRFKEEIRDGSVRRDSLSRDSGISSIRENSVLDFTSRRDRESSLTRDSSRLSSVGVIDDLADLRTKYSPSNYVPTIHRKNENITRSKSINDIGLPPIEKTKKKVTEGVNANMSVLPTTSTNDNCSNNDDNGNRASVADLRKRFDKITDNKSIKTTVNVEPAEVKLSDNKFKILDQSNLKLNGEKITNGLRTVKKSNLPKTIIKKAPVHTDDSKIENSESNVRSIKIAGVHKDSDDHTRPIQRNVPKIHHKFNIDKKPTNFDKKLGEKRTSIHPERKDKSKITKDDTDTNILLLKVDGELNKLTNGLAEAKKTDKESECRIIEQTNGIVSPNASVENLLLDPTTNVSRTNNFASYIPNQDFEAGDARQPTIVNITFDVGNDVEGSQLERSPKIAKEATTSKLIKSRASPSNTATINAHSNSSALNSNNGVYRRERRSVNDDDTHDRSTGYSHRIGSGSPSPGATSTPKTIGLNGLKNIGNTCFMNSVIQCLSNTKLLLEYLRQDHYVKDINVTNSSMKGSLIKAFAEVIKELWAEDTADRSINTIPLKNQIQRFAPRFMGFAQQDAQEFLRYLLEGLHEDVNRVTEKPTPIHKEIDDKLSDLEKSTEAWNRYLRMDNSRIVDIFVGQLKSTLKCTFCGHCSVTFDPFWDLSIPIPRPSPGHSSLTLWQCLESFTREETLDGDEKPTCSKCKERRKCTKSFSIQKFPKILVIHLKRFSPLERYRCKLSSPVEFPLEALDMSKHAAEGVTTNRYNLYAVANHSGTTYSGHYMAFCRHPYVNTWFEYNDSRVFGVPPKTVESTEAYLLFYEQEGQRSHL